MADTSRPLLAACLLAAIALGGGPVSGQALDNRITETRDLPTWQLQQTRKRMLRDQWISFEDMRALADVGDGLAAFRYAERLLALDDPDLRSAAALYYASSALTGRDYAVHALVSLLEQEDIDFSEERLVHLENALRNLALQGSEKAKRSLLEFFETGHPFGRRPDAARALRADMAEAGDGQAALELAMDRLSGNQPEDEDRVVELLEIAATSQTLGTRVTAENLLDQYINDTGKEAQ